jgi:hypothetical protein
MRLSLLRNSHSALCPGWVLVKAVSVLFLLVVGESR